MPKISPLDAITQQLDDLSLDQLLEVRARVDALIEEKSLRSSIGSYGGVTLISSERTDVDYFVTIPSSRIKLIQVSELKATENGDSLEKVIDLVDEWMADESGYDEETYPQIEAALNQNHLSL